jgi:hypothetical protein
MDVSYLDGWNAKHFARNDGESLICNRHHISYEVLCYESWLSVQLYVLFHCTLKPRLNEQILFDKFHLIKCIWSKGSMLAFVQMRLSQ